MRLSSLPLRPAAASSSPSFPALRPVALAILVLGKGTAALLPRPAIAQQTQTAAQRSYDVPAGSLGEVLNRIGREAGVLVTYGAVVPSNAQSAGVRGQFSVEQALAKALQGSGLVAVQVEGGGFAVRAAPKPATEATAEDADQAQGADYTLREVRVSAKRLGETEGTGSYTSDAITVGKTAQAMREMPQTVSVVTRQRMEDQELNDLGKVAEQTVGVTVQDQGFRLTNLYSRGFAINSFQLDGGAPIDKGFVANVAFDMAQYDRVEFLRGPAGLLNGTGNPGGAVNLVRKMPAATPQFNVSASAGRWDNYRTEVDASGPLAFDGKLRGRAVMMQEKRHYFIDRRSSDRPLFYGVLEADVGPDAVVAIGARDQQLKERGNATDLPRYSNGLDLRLPRNTSMSSDWSRLDGSSKEIFAKLTWRLADRWTLRANAAQTKQSGESKFGSMQGAIDPITGQGARWVAARNIYSNQQNLLDVNLSGAFDLLGHTHELLLGADMQDITSRWRGAYPVSGNNVPGDIFNPNSLPFPEPVFGAVERDYNPWAQKQYGVYGTLRMELAKGTKLIVGARANKYRFNQAYWEMYDANGDRTTDLQLADATRYAEPTKVTPFGGLVYDINADWTAYASYAQIFNPQYGSKAGPAPGTGLPPMRGTNLEAGVKGELLNGKLNTSFALYRTTQDRQAVQDPRYPWSSELYAGSCCYLASGKVISQGLDMEVSGEVARGVNLVAGYTYNNNRDKTENAVFSTITPRHLLKLWGTWQLPGEASGWTLGGGTTIQSTQYVSGSANSYNPESGKFDGASVPYKYTQGGYALWNGFVQYRIDPNWTVSLNVSNLFDKVYYRTVGSSFGGNYYGEPRNVSVALRGKF